MAIGIVSISSYIPKYRLSREDIYKAWENIKFPGERAVCNFDEDVITMSTEAALNCIEDSDSKKIDALYFATTTSPYLEKLSASIIAAAIDLREEILSCDFTNTIRASTIALRQGCDSIKAGSVNNVLICSGDMRLAEPETPNEMVFADGASSLLIGKENILAEIKETYSFTHEFLGYWRRSRDVYVDVSNPRFFEDYGYIEDVSKAIKGILSKSNLELKDIKKVIIYFPDARLAQRLVKKMKLTNLQDPTLLFMQVGNTGTSAVFLMLNQALEESKPHDKILLINFGDGADAILFEVTDNIDKMKKGLLQKYINSKVNLPYGKYLYYRRIIDKPQEVAFSSPPIVWREQHQNFPLCGSKCKRCGEIHFPIQRVCRKCKSKDEMEVVRLKRRGKLHTYVHDYLIRNPTRPTTMAVINIEDGGRIYTQLTDTKQEEVKIDMDIELTFRKFHEGGGFANYFWKGRAPRLM